jgi:hypothetical protein
MVHFYVHLSALLFIFLLDSTRTPAADRSCAACWLAHGGDSRTQKVGVRNLRIIKKSAVLEN